MKKLKSIVKEIFGDRLIKLFGRTKRNLINLILLVKNTYEDGKLFYKHSMVFRQNTFNKLESRIILHYHGLEKGFLHGKFKYRFGENRVKELIVLLKKEEVIKNKEKTQVAAAYLSMCKYYEKHKKDGVDISDFFSNEIYYYFQNLSTLDLEIVKPHTVESFFEFHNSNFLDFSKSRGSVRSFSGEKIPIETINKVIELAKTAPSVCNRQPNKIYYIDNKSKIEKIFEIQKGLKGYSDEIVQLLVLVSDRNYFYSVGERNQLYIDGGIFLMNLLYALHFYKIGACPAHWGLNKDEDKKIKVELNIKDSEKVICLIPIGIPKSNFLTTLSLRRNYDEILII